MKNHPIPFSLRTAALALGIAVALAACSQTAPPPPPTRTPAPTFTPTVAGADVPVDANALATVQAAQQAQAAQPLPAADQGQVPVAGGQPAVESTSVFSDIAPSQPAAPAVATVAPPQAPANAQVTVTEIVNVRGGPGLTYNILGQANPGQTYPVTGKSPDGQWWQFTFNGQPGWVFGELVTAQNTESVAIAQNIPVAPPPPTAAPVVVAPPADTPVPAPAEPAPAEPAPTPEPAKSNYKFNITAVSKCDRQPAGNWFEGKTYVGGVPQSGYKVVFSYAPDAEPITAPVISGPHQGYPGWDQGYYSHIISSSKPLVGTWYVWIVDDAGQRISEIASWTSTGPGEGCNQAVVDFDSR